MVIPTGLSLAGGETPMQGAADQALVASGGWSAFITADDGESSDRTKSLRPTAERVHDVAANLILFPAALPVAGVFVESPALHRNLVKPTIRGNRHP